MTNLRLNQATANLTLMHTASKRSAGATTPPLLVGLLVLVAVLLTSIVISRSSGHRERKATPSTYQTKPSRDTPKPPDTAELSRIADSVIRTIPLDSVPLAGAGALLWAIYKVESAPQNVDRTRWLSVARTEANKRSADEVSGQSPEASKSNQAASSRRAAADAVMSNASHLCSIYTEDPHLVVECRNLPVDSRLEFAQAIAEADAVIEGEARNIYFYIGGVQFAQGDPVHGVRLK